MRRRCTRVVLLSFPSAPPSPLRLALSLEYIRTHGGGGGSSTTDQQEEEEGSGAAEDDDELSSVPQLFFDSMFDLTNPTT